MTEFKFDIDPSNPVHVEAVNTFLRTVGGLTEGSKPEPEEKPRTQKPKPAKEEDNSQDFEKMKVEAEFWMPTR